MKVTTKKKSVTPKAVQVQFLYYSAFGVTLFFLMEGDNFGVIIHLWSSKNDRGCKNARMYSDIYLTYLN
jgi:hypothetical protein